MRNLIKIKSGINMYEENNLGFTLFELLVSISIIAILTAMVSLSYSVAQKKARDARRRQDMESVQKRLNNIIHLLVIIVIRAIRTHQQTGR